MNRRSDTDKGPKPSDQIATVRDADEYLTGQWVSPARYTQDELDAWPRSHRLELARKWIDEDGERAQRLSRMAAKNDELAEKRHAERTLAPEFIAYSTEKDKQQ